MFDKDWKYRDKQYTCPGKFEEVVNLSVCYCGMHFCKRLIDCFNYYCFDPENKVAEVIAYGKIDEKGDKCCTDKLEIGRELTWFEVLENVNTGRGCTGIGNNGDWNSGNWNSGDCNSGDQNSGDQNSGNRNSGDCNSGNWNSGDWNNTDHSSGCFNTTEERIYMFNKPTNLRYTDWRNSRAYYLLKNIQRNGTEWIKKAEMTQEEKEANPECEITGGYLKILGEDHKDHNQKWWDGLSEEDKNEIRSLPNFDREIFEEITGIKI